jgi:hypothetical protein
VLLITVVALPIAVPPAVVIGLTLGLFHVVELAVWALLKLTHRAQRHRGRVPPKQVNRPTFDWRL